MFSSLVGLFVGVCSLVLQVWGVVPQTPRDMCHVRLKLEFKLWFEVKWRLHLKAVIAMSACVALRKSVGVCI